MNRYNFEPHALAEIIQRSAKFYPPKTDNDAVEAYRLFLHSIKTLPAAKGALKNTLCSDGQVYWINYEYICWAAWVCVDWLKNSIEEEAQLIELLEEKSPNTVELINQQKQENSLKVNATGYEDFRQAESLIESQPDKAFDYLKTAIEKGMSDNYNASAYRKLGELYESVEQNEAALLCYQKAIEFNPKVGVTKRIKILQKQL